MEKEDMQTSDTETQWILMEILDVLKQIRDKK